MKHYIIFVLFSSVMVLKVDLLSSLIHPSSFSVFPSSLVWFQPDHLLLELRNQELGKNGFSHTFVENLDYKKR